MSHAYTRVAADEFSADAEDEGLIPRDAAKASSRTPSSSLSLSSLSFHHLCLLLLLLPHGLAVFFLSPYFTSSTPTATVPLLPPPAISPAIASTQCPPSAPCPPSTPCPLTPSPPSPSSSSSWGWSAPLSECPLGHVDLFLVLQRHELPLTGHLMRSLEMFLPCYGHLHLFCDEDVEVEVYAWVHVHERVRFHRLWDDRAGEEWEVMKAYPGYLVQQWLMMWADELVEPSAEFVLFFDTDVVLTLPVTCQSLFDEGGRPYMPYWTSSWQTQYYPSCQELVHDDCSRSFMAYLPILFPIASFNPMRAHLMDRMEKVKGIARGTFNGMLHRYFNTSGWRLFSQFIVMGNFVFHYQPDSIHPILYPMFKDGVAGEAAEYVPPGLHYGWISCRYLESCPPGVNGEMFRGQLMHNYSDKYALPTVQLIQQILHRGHCLTEYSRAMEREGVTWTATLADERPQLVPRSCSARQVNELHPMVRPYADQPPPMASIYARYAPMKVPGPKCSAHQ